MKNLYVLLVTLLILTSCTVTKPLTSSVSVADVTDIQLFEPVSMISLIETGNKGKYNDSTSQISKALLTTTLKSFPQNIPITGEITSTDNAVKIKLTNDIEYLCGSADKEKSISNLKITPTLDSLLEATGKRFGLIAVSTGFTRRKGNYGGQIAKGILTGVLTMGMYYTTPVKSYSTVYVMIVDAKENNIAFFRKSFLQDKDPLDEGVLSKQVQKAFEGYFWAAGSM
ncbi:hypothetical protein GCM10027049_28540 [Mucilaginibacter puniceus]